MLSNETIVQIIQRVNLISPELLSEVTGIVDREKRRLSDVVIERNIIKPDELGQLLANYYKVKFIDLRKEAIAPEVLNLIPEVVARKRFVIAFRRDAEGLKLAM